MSKAKRPARTLERRRKREKAKSQGSPRAESANAGPQAQVAALNEAATGPEDTPWYSRPPQKRFWALVSVAVLLAAWWGYLFWLAIYHGRGSG